MLNEYIFSLEKGLETIINDKSTNISGGEKQKISIIRQLIKNQMYLYLMNLPLI